MKEGQQYVEHGCYPGQTGLDLESQTMVNALEITDDGDHR
jgi:hypothetical protein